jgi:hypothetical protein
LAILPDQDLGFSGASTTVITVSGTFPAGALICVSVGFGTATSGQSISQSGTTFTNIVTRENSATNNLVYWIGYIANYAGGALSTTFTLSGTGKDAAARILSFTGVKAVIPLLFTPKDAGGAPSSTTFDSGVASGTALQKSLLVGFFTFANSASLTAPISQSGEPTQPWLRTNVSDGSSGNTPHGHAIMTYLILGSQPVAAPQATLTSGAARSYSATIAAFQEDFNPYVDGYAPLMQIASRTLLPANTLTRTVTPVSMPLIATVTRTITPVSMPLDNTAATRTVTPVSMPLVATLTRTVTPVSMPLVATLTRTINPVSMPLIGTQTRTVTPVSMPLIATVTRTVTPASMPLIATNTRTVSNVFMPLSAAGTSTRTVSPVSMPLVATLTRTVTSVQMPLSGVVAQLLTPVGSIAGPFEPTGAITAGTVLSGTIAGGLQPGGIIQAGTAPSGTIVPGTKPDGTIVRN